MAGQYAVLKAAIEAVIKTNGNKEITGALMQQSLLSMITSLGAYYDFVDVATPSTNPGTPDQNVMYFAATAGTYTNFGGIVVNDGEFCALCWNGQWTKKTTGAATAEQVTALGHKVDGLDADFYAVQKNYFPYIPVSGEVTASKCIKNQSGVPSVANASPFDIHTIQVKAGQRIHLRFSKTPIVWGAGDYFIYSAYNSATIGSASLVYGLAYSAYATGSKPLEFYYTATSDGIMVVTLDKTATLTIEVMGDVFNPKIAKLHLTAPSYEYPRPGFALKADGTLLGSSANTAVKVRIAGMSSFVIGARIGYLPGNNIVQWFTADDAGNVISASDVVTSWTTSGGVNYKDFPETEHTISASEKWLYYAYMTSDPHLSVRFYTDKSVKEQIEDNRDDFPLVDIRVPDATIMEQLNALLNTKAMRDDFVNGSAVFTLPTQALTDATMAMDSDNYYCVCVSTGGGVDVWQSTNCTTILYIVNKSTLSISQKTVASPNMQVTIDGVSATLTRGGSMPNIAVISGRAYIVFSAMVNGEFVLLRCIYDPVAGTIGNYAQCMVDGQPLTLAGLVALGYDLPTDGFDNPQPMTINVNGNFHDALYNGYYYVGMCGASILKNPFILKTADLTNFSVYKYLASPLGKAAFECSTAIVGTTLYCAARQGGGYTNSPYYQENVGKYTNILLFEIDLATGRIVKFYSTRGAASRPCLFKAGDSVMMIYNTDNTRNNARIINLNAGDYMETVQELNAVWSQTLHAYFQIMAEPGASTYFYFSGRDMWRVHIGSASVYDADNLFEAIAALL